MIVLLSVLIFASLILILTVIPTTSGMAVIHPLNATSTQTNSTAISDLTTITTSTQTEYYLNMNISFTSPSSTVLIDGSQRNLYGDIRFCDAGSCFYSQGYGFQGQGPEWGFGSPITDLNSLNVTWFFGVFSPSSLNVLFDCGSTPATSNQDCISQTIPEQSVPATWALPNGTIINAWGVRGSWPASQNSTTSTSSQVISTSLTSFTTLTNSSTNSQIIFSCPSCALFNPASAGITDGSYENVSQARFFADALIYITSEGGYDHFFNYYNNTAIIDIPVNATGIEWSIYSATPGPFYVTISGIAQNTTIVTDNCNCTYIYSYLAQGTYYIPSSSTTQFTRTTNPSSSTTQITSVTSISSDATTMIQTGETASLTTSYFIPTTQNQSSTNLVSTSTTMVTSTSFDQVTSSVIHNSTSTATVTQNETNLLTETRIIYIPTTQTILTNSSMGENSSSTTPQSSAVDSNLIYAGVGTTIVVIATIGSMLFIRRR